MSRRPPNPAAERAAQNQATIKSLLKLDTNKICADCKKNKHPRWASWNLGVFICIRCSGIHRGMGTHISRVKSVDLDSWTDEQLASILSWGNARANKYWENKLANGHVPSEAKIENFIRTKYELKRWVMEGPMPDPATLNVDGDDDIPLSIVKEKQQIERKESIRKASVGQSAAPSNVQGDLIGGDDLPPRASTAGPSAVAQAPPPKAAPAPAKTTTAKDSLFDLDFLGTTPAAPPRPASTTGTAAMGGGQSRPDLKQSILSLYASAPRPQAQSQQGHNPSGSFGSFGSMASPVQSPTMGHHAQKSTSSNLAGDFAGLSFGSSSVTSPKSPPKDAFAGLTSFGSSNKSTPQPAATMGGLGGGSFFDSKPAKPAAPQAMSPMSPSNSFGGWGAPAPAPAKPAQPASSAMGDLFDLSSPAPAPTSLPTKAPSPPAPAPAPAMDSVFNLSAPKPTSPPAAAANPMASAVPSSFSNSDVWGNAWGEPAAPAAPAVKSPALSQPSGFGGNDFGAWGSTGGSLASQSIVPGQSGSLSVTPAVAADEEFGGWTSSTGGGASSNSAAKPQGGFGGGEDLFGNVWQ